jgi:acyl transferase domain-containing protein/acyl carrier protein
MRATGFGSGAQRPLAVIGMAARFPGAASAEQFWSNQRAIRSCFSEVPKDRWRWQDYFGDPAKDGAKTNSPWGAFLSDLDQFDPLAFGISPGEAELMDPQHRLFLKATWEAIGDAGYSPASLRGRRIGVFAGVQFQEYQQLLLRAGLESAWTCTGNAQTMLANRVSYLLDLHGPSESIDTACSSSLVAIHHAARAVLDGECEMAIAGGVNVFLVPDVFIMGSQLGVLSTSGVCRPLDADADGYVRGEGAGVVFLKPLEAAERDGDHVRAILKGSAMNHGGRAASLTAPRANAQADVMARAIERSGVRPEEVSYVEMHATGTRAGDPSEFQGVVDALRVREVSSSPSWACGLGSIKSNIGHLEAAAGVAGVINTVLAIEDQWLPGMASFRRLNPAIALDGTPFFISNEGRPWITDGLRCALVNSFGFGGANASVVVGEYQREGEEPSPVDLPAEDVFLPLSAPSRRQLQAYGVDLARKLQGLWRQGARQEALIRDVRHTLQVGRSSGRERALIRFRTLQELMLGLCSLGNGGASSRSISVDAGPAALSAAPAHAAAWLKGSDAPWPAIEGGRRVSLPVVPWADARYWFEASERLPNEGSRASAVAAHEDEGPPSSVGFVYLRPAWRREALLREPRSAASTDAGILLLAEDAADAQALRGAAHGSHLEVMIEDFAQLNLEPQRLRAAAQRLPAGPDAIFICPSSTARPGSDASLRSVELLFQLAKELLSRRLEKRTEVFFLPAAERGSEPHESAIEALAKSISLESERLPCSVVYVGRDQASWAARVLEEWQRGGSIGPRCVALRDAARHVLGLERVQRLAPAAPHDQVGLRAGGVYLMPGGAGELGRRLAPAMTRAGAKVALVGRGAAEPDSELAALLARDESVSYLRADVSELTQARRVVEEVLARWGRIDGILQLVTAHDDAMIFNKSWSDFRAVSAGKVQGTVNLDEATSALELDFFVVFSSQAALGMAGACDYAYGCEFQNQFVAYRNALRSEGKRQGRSIAINWSRWKWDKYVTEKFDEWVMSLGYEFLDIDRGVEGLTQILRAADAGIYALYGQADRLLQSVDMKSGMLARAAHEQRWKAPVEPRRAVSAPASGVDRLLEELTVGELEALAARLENGEASAEGAASSSAGSLGDGSVATEPGASAQRVRRVLSAVLQRALKLSTIDADTEFQDIGLDSIVAVNVIAALEAELGDAGMHPNWFFESPTVEALSDRIARNLEQTATNGSASMGTAAALASSEFRAGSAPNP